MADKTQEGSFTSTLPGGSPLYFKVETKYKVDAAGNPISGSATHTLLYNPGNNQYYPAATTTDFKTFELEKYTPAEIANAGIAQYAQPDGTVLGPTAAQSLQTSGGQLNKEMRNATALTSINNGLSVGQAQAVNGAPQTIANAPVTPTDPENPNGANPPAPPFKKEDAAAGGKLLNDLSIGNRTGTRGINEYPIESLLRYPITMDPKQDCIKFTMLEYAPRKLSVSSSTLDIQEDRSSASGKRRGSTVVLPIQPSISDSNNVKWGSADMSTIRGIAASVAMKAITGDSNFTETTSELASIYSGLSAGKDSIKSQFAADFAGKAAGVKGLLTRVAGAIENPNMELLFDGPDLRTFSFSFSLSAREPGEAKNIRNIIRFFKQGMSVKRADTGLFLKSPNTFEIKYIYAGGDDHPWINKIKECALTSCTVNYTPAGNYATYEDGSMTQYDISLSFSELEPIYDDDYKGGGEGHESEIGY